MSRLTKRRLTLHAPLAMAQISGGSRIFSCLVYSSTSPTRSCAHHRVGHDQAWNKIRSAVHMVTSIQVRHGIQDTGEGTCRSAFISKHLALTSSWPCPARTLKSSVPCVLLPVAVITVVVVSA